MLPISLCSDCNPLLMINNMIPEEKKFTLHGFTYVAQLWGEAGQLPVIALHGWLDNSASFDVLAPQLQGVQCLAIDLAGHGLSDHHSGLTDYPLWSEISAIYAIADQMGWQQFALMGHSRGAMMSLLIAGVFPERISHLIMLDSMAPPMVASDQAPKRMIDSIEEIQRRIHRKMSLYRSFDDAISARCQSRFTPVQPETAKLLATRGLQDVDGQFHWHADGKLWAPSNVALSADMVGSFVQKIANASIPSLLLLGATGLVNIENPESDQERACERFVKELSTQVQIFEDGHFLHMEKANSDVASAINQFFCQGEPSV